MSHINITATIDTTVHADGKTTQEVIDEAIAWVRSHYGYNAKIVFSNVSGIDERKLSLDEIYKIKTETEEEKR